ncbi:MAG: hypothetical protein BMS9Abin36_1496 [Gammaproteobacteria bacterium]|nr:MAG: hypothetical protein BMS9Abin36_1496 [Gammaproteobacteria bacterium]
MKKLASVIALLITALSLNGCVDQKAQARAVYMLVDTSGTYAKQMNKAKAVVNFILSEMNPGESFAVARIKSRSFTEKDIIAKVTFDSVPSRVHAQKRAFRVKFDKFASNIKYGSAHTDITGGIIQGAEFLAESGSGKKMILIYSDMQEELDKKTIRDFPISLDGIQFVALNVTKLKTDNIDPRRYLGRLANWEQRVMNAGAKEWRVVNDLERLERIFKAG